MALKIPRLGLFPLTAGLTAGGHLGIGGCDTVALAAEYGTPLYVFDEATLRGQCAEFRTGFGQRYADSLVLYAGKAFLGRDLLHLLREAGLGLDVVSGGELGIARAAGFPLERVYFHGNNKSDAELVMGLEWGIGRFVVDNFSELARLDRLAGERGAAPGILLRLTPGVDPHTHQYISTGVVDSKFGFTWARAAEAVVQAMSAGNLNLVGLHFHLGSLIFETEPYRTAIDLVLNFAAEMKAQHGFELGELNVGGGFAVQYTVDTPAPPAAAYAGVIAPLVTATCRKLGLALPRLVVEPGRAIVGQAGVALYRVGVV
ncbi:MAG: diaminopimelate decarboxylase, partial [Chloroflexota bacterium]